MALDMLALHEVVGKQREQPRSNGDVDKQEWGAMPQRFETKLSKDINVVGNDIMQELQSVQRNTTKEKMI